MSIYESCPTLESGKFILRLFEEKDCDGIITKVPIYAVERAKAMQRAAFAKSEEYLIGKTGFAYDGYWVKK